jgi:hypothetical protein
MESSGRFLLGGALGAALGYLLSQKNLERAPQTGQISASAAVPAGPVADMGLQGGAPTASAVATPAFFAASPVSAPEQRAVQVPSPATSVPEWTIPPAPPAEWRPAPETPLALDTQASQVVTPAMVEPAEAEVIVTREFLEEPLPGSGWRSHTPPAVEDEAVQEWASELPVAEDVMEAPAVEEFVELPVVEEAFTDTMGPGTAGTEALVQAASVADRLPQVDSPLADDISRVDDLKSRIEETRRRIRHELEQPFDISSPARPLERDWTTAPAVPIVARPAPTSPLVMQPAVMEPLAVEALPLESLEVETLPTESTFMEPVAVEPVVVEPVIVEPAVAEPVAVEPAMAEPMIAEPVAAEALSTEPVEVELAVVESVEVELVTIEPVAAEPEIPVLAAKPVAAKPLAEEPVKVEPVAAEREAPVVDGLLADLEVETSVGEVDIESGPDEPVDYDSMKNRIESTRSRLKAKAFDAMMTGETALLGRDLDGVSHALGKVGGVDNDIDETIETSLREEEE